MLNQSYPLFRPRRLRQNETIRRMVRETHLSPDNLIAGLFVRHGEGMHQPIASMPGQAQLSVDNLVREAETLAELGVPAVLLFGIPQHKDEIGSENYDPHGIVPQAIRALKAAVPQMLVISDMCFCEYTTHGHCGLINTLNSAYYNPHLPAGYLLNDPTLQLLARASVVHAEAGADIIAPSGMIDGMVLTIRGALDTAGFDHVPIMSYAAKFASSFYGPFRDAAESGLQGGDRRNAQIDPPNSREALKEVELDVREGADILMVKPAMPYLDILTRMRDAYHLPLAAYQVSGEYSMIKAAVQQGWLDEKQAVLETLGAIRRAGADMIITYFAKDAARWLQEK